MKTNNDTEFRNDCKVINLSMEYEGYTGDVMHAIITDLTEEELEARYSNEINQYRPFVILTREMGAAMKEYDRNEKKHQMRQIRNEYLLDCTKDYDSLVRLLSVEDYLDQKVAEFERQQFIEFGRIAMQSLTQLQKEYLIRHYLRGESYVDIAKSEGKSVSTISRSCHGGRTMFIKTIRELEAEA